ncbi:Gfo/Idh/MocA family oxidoreductase [Saccharopolyspora taberi]
MDDNDVRPERFGLRSPGVDALRLAVVGAGRIGANHAEIVARRIPGVRLVAVADPVESAAQRLASELGAEPASLEDVLARDDVDGVLISAPARAHADLVVAAAAAGKHVFCEKPMAVTLADAERAVGAAEEAGVVLQVGFNRRFAPGFVASRARIDDGQVGNPQILRSLTRDPGPFAGDPARVPQWTIFLETLIHDFDILCWLNPGATPQRVHAFADALVSPEARSRGHLDTAVVSIQFDNGAIATADANFSALYGYDVRAEVFGSKGMVTTGNARATDMTFYDADGIHTDTSRRDTDLLRSAYVAELTAFADSILHGSPVRATGAEARTALSIALAAIRSVETGATVAIADVDTAVHGLSTGAA